MAPGLIWILAGLLLLGAELLLPGVYLIWVGLAAVATGLVLLVAAPGFGAAVAVFLVLLAAGVALSLLLRPRGGGRSRVNAPEAGLVGRPAVLVSGDAAALRVRLGDTEWPARMPPGIEPPLPGTPVRVEAVEGTVLVVRTEARPGA